jgi:DNA-binding beta-propeller fold protein YncE
VKERLQMRRRWAATICAAAIAALGIGAAPAQAAPEDPIFEYVPAPPRFLFTPLLPPPVAYLNGPCGLGVDSSGRFYVSDYYHDVVDVFKANDPGYTNPSPAERATGYITQLAGIDADDGPCGLALDSSDNLYVNDYHRAVIRYAPSPSFGAGVPIAGNGVDAEHPTGVAVDPATGDVYVDNRDHVAVYDSSGAAIDRIGEGSLLDGYGVAFSAYPATLGFVYAPDAATNTVKVYDPATDKANPVDEIDASDTPAGRFISLRDAAIAVDHATGEIYVVDNTQPQYTERPQALVYAFDSAGAWEGQLKYKVTDALPSGLAVDNSATATQSRVYVTSGNTDFSGIYAYGPGAATRATALAPTISSLGAGGGGREVAGPPAPDNPTPPEGTQDDAGETSRASSPVGASSSLATTSVITQRDNLRLTVNGRLSPNRLPRDRSAPIGVSVDWDLASTDGADVPKLKSLRIEINRHGRFDATGLPVCPYPKIQPATTSRALSGCPASLLGKGSITAKVGGIEGQEPYETTGRLTVFNGRRGGKPVLYGHIYASRPFAISFVIVFKMARKRRGAYGTVLSATLPRTLRNWGNLTGLEMTLRRSYRHKRRSRSFVTGSCPAPRGFTQAVFPLARASFGFEGARGIGSTLGGTCRVRG